MGRKKECVIEFKLSEAKFSEAEPHCPATVTFRYEGPSDLLVRRMLFIKRTASEKMLIRNPECRYDGLEAEEEESAAENLRRLRAEFHSLGVEVDVSSNEEIAKACHNLSVEPKPTKMFRLLEDGRAIDLG